MAVEQDKREGAAVSPTHARRAGGDRAGRNPDGTNVGGALRAAYQDAVEEAVPQEMLDLLAKLR